MATMHIRIQDGFPAAHRIRIDERGTLEPVHVHHWRVDACIEPRTPDAVVGARARRVVRDWVARHRGRSLNDVPPFDEINPTAEEVARVLTRELEANLENCRVVRVTIGEAAGFSATYWPREQDASREIAFGI